jgi:hypothetical protein
LTSLLAQNGQAGSASADISASVELCAEVFDWYHNWRTKWGRPLRVLYLGNIANNAFNNARIQRQYGVDSYVIAYENYHIMACPEWEEATFEGDLGDPFFPDWRRVEHGTLRAIPFVNVITGAGGNRISGSQPCICHQSGLHGGRCAPRYPGRSILASSPRI